MYARGSSVEFTLLEWLKPRTCACAQSQAARGIRSSDTNGVTDMILSAVKPSIFATSMALTRMNQSNNTLAMYCTCSMDAIHVVSLSESSGFSWALAGRPPIW